MPAEKSELLRGFFDQIESQVQFGDHKASLLVAGDALLLAVSGGLIQMEAGCPANEFSVPCMHPSVPLALALLTALLLIVSLGCALRAARPAGIHEDPPPSIFLLSHIARLEPKQFVETYRAASAEDLEEAFVELRPMGLEALRLIFGHEMQKVLQEHVESGRTAAISTRSKNKAKKK